MIQLIFNKMLIHAFLLQGAALNRVQFSRPIRVVDAGGSNQADFVESTGIVLYSFV